MKKILIIIVILLTNTTFAQQFDFKLIEKLTDISFQSIDEFMIEGYGFNKLNKKSNDEKRTYARHYNGDINNTIIISVFDQKNKKNFIDIYLARNYNSRTIKDKLLNLNYEFIGSNEYGYVIFRNENSLYLISKEPIEGEATHIMVITE